MSDLIRREDVNKAVRSICDLCGEDKKYNGVMCGACNLDNFISVFENIPSAEPERKKGKWIKHENPTLGQCLKIVYECSVCHTGVGCEYFVRRSFCPNCGADMRGDHILNHIPSAEPERKWIPVTEALPEEDEEVLVTVRFDGTKDVKPSVYVETASQISGTWLSYSDEWKVSQNRHHVIAWMPLPEPWRGDR